MMNCKEFKRKQPCVNRVAVLPFTYRVMRSVQKPRRPDEIRTTHLLNMSLEFQPPPHQPLPSQDSYRSTKIPYSPNIKGSQAGPQYEGTISHYTPATKKKLAIPNRKGLNASP
jgi:hypothetical protein